MKGAIAETRNEHCSEVSRQTTEVGFALHRGADFSEPHFREVLGDPNKPYSERTRVALALAWCDRLKLWPSVDLSCYRVGPTGILHLPGEAFVEYRLYARSLRPDDFIATAAYGELGTKPEIYQALEERGVKYAIRLPANENLERNIEELLRRPVGRPSQKPVVRYKGFLYRAASWSKARRVVAKVEFHAGELFPGVGFIVTNLELPSRAVVWFCNKRGTAEQCIKEGKQAGFGLRLG